MPSQTTDRTPLADMLVERGWLSPSDRADDLHCSGLLCPT